MSVNYQELPQLRDSISYIYVEYGSIEQDQKSIALIRKDEKIPIPISSTTVILMGPGTRISHAAVKAMSSSGCSAVWCGSEMQRFYSFGSPETKSSKNVISQAKYCSDEKLHLEVAKRMYAIRFKDFNAKSDYSLQQLRGLEGVRVREAYKRASSETGVEWKSRNYKIDSWDDSDDINKALSQANAILYSVCEAAIVSLGYSTALGFIHTGKMLSFVYDIADIYKADSTIPAAFEAVRDYELGDSLSELVRKKLRQKFIDMHLLKRIPKDIAKIFNDIDDTNNDVEVKGMIWDENENVSSGINYGDLRDGCICD